MIASRRGLAVLAGIASLLAVVVVVDSGGPPPAADRALVPDFDAARVTELAWDRPGAQAIRATRTAAGWQVRVGTGAPVVAAPGAVADVLAALRGARWHRRAAPAASHASLAVTTGAARRVLALGEPIAGTDQAWISDGDHGVVVDRWVIRALDRDALSLRITTPLAEIRRAETLTVGGLKLVAGLRELRAPQPLWLDPARSEALARALAEVTIVRIPQVAIGPVGPDALVIAASGAGVGGGLRVALGGACPGEPARVALIGTLGDGCIEAAALHAVEQAVSALRRPAIEIVDHRPVPFEPHRVVLPDAAVLELSPPRIAGAAADPARVAELLAALAAPATPVERPARAATQQLVVTDRDGAALALELFAERVVARRGEPVALRLAPGAWGLLARPSRVLRDATLWLEEPTMVTALRVDGVRYTRGAVIGAWTRVPTGPVEGAAIEAVVAALAAPRALGFTAAPTAVAHRVALTVTPPAGPPVERVLELGARRSTGCPARAASESPTTDDAILLPAALCTQIAGLAR